MTLPTFRAGTDRITVDYLGSDKVRASHASIAFTVKQAAGRRSR